MTPSDKSLLLCIRRTIAGMLPGIQSKAHQAILQSIDLHLNELLLRMDPAFYRDYYRRGRALLKEGVELGLSGDHLLSEFPELLSDGLSADAIGEYAERVTASLEILTTAAGVPTSGDLLAYLNKISDWEISLYEHRFKSGGGRDYHESEVKLTLPALQDYLRHKFPDLGDVQVTGFESLYGGFSKATTMFSTDRPIRGCQDFVIRAEQQANIILLDGGTVDLEFPVVSIAFEQGVLVPEPLWLELDRSKLGARFIVFRRAKGENCGTAVGASTKLDKSVLESLARELVRIHAIKLDPEDPRVKRSHLPKWLAAKTLEDNTRDYYEYWLKVLEDSPHSPSTLIQRGLNWVSRNIPDCSDDEINFIHGDYGLHNLLIHEGKVSAILDWEASRAGDRAEELSWFISCMTGGATAEELLSLYYEAGGKPISAERLHFYDVFRCVQMMIVCNVALVKLHQRGDNISLGVIGFQMNQSFASRLRALIG